MKKPTQAPENLPFSPEAEEATIGAALTNPDMFALMGAYLKADDFFLLRHQYIWAAMTRIAAHNSNFDYLLVAEDLQSHNQLDDIGGHPYLLRLVNHTPSSSNGELYAKLVWYASLRRRGLQALWESAAILRDETLTLDLAMSKVEGLIFAVTQESIERSEQTLGEAVSEAGDEIEQRMNGANEFYVPTGFTAIDYSMGGMERGCLHIVGGRPGMGKSSFCLGVAMNAARLGVRTLYVSTEMPNKRLAMRALSMETGINLQDLKRGQMSDQQINRYVEAMGRLQSVPLVMDYIPSASVTQVRAKVARMQREKGLDLLIVDGLWQMTAPEVRFTDRDQINGWIGNRLVDLAKAEFNIPILLAHQLNRNCEHRQDHRPVMSDLDYGGQLERHADVIMFLYRDEVYDEATEFPGQADVIFAKNRDGRQGTVSLYFEKSTTRFLNSTARTIDLRSVPTHARNDGPEITQ